jgi:uncharacterized protein (TIGR00730 family)
MPQSSLAVFCGSSTGGRPEYTTAARRLAAVLVRRDIRLVYGAGSVGLMGVLPDEVLALGGEVMGVIPQFLVDKEVGHRGLTELVVTQSMHERKLIMAENADGFLALPGGIGTLEELIEVYTWTQLGIHRKSCGLLNTLGYYDRLLELLNHMAAERFFRRDHLQQLRVDTDPERVVQAVLSESPVYRGKGLDR